MLDGLKVLDERKEHTVDHVRGDGRGTLSRHPPSAIPPRLLCAGMAVRPSIYAVISATGNRPPCRCAIRVRSAGGSWNADTAGPLYLVSNLATAEEACRWYEKRFRIETFFSDGVKTFQPQKKPKGKELTLEQKEQNRLISSIRIVIEHIIAGIKRLV